MHRRLCSESVLLIRREDVLQRLTAGCCLSSLSGPRWKALDVEGNNNNPNNNNNKVLIHADLSILYFVPGSRLSGQVRRMQLEEESGDVTSTHVQIPAAYSSGVTLFALRQSDVGRELLAAPELQPL